MSRLRRLVWVLLLTAGMIAAQGRPGPAQAAAQAEPLVVTITALDIANFPYVVANLSVTDADGNNLPPLAASDFSVIEDGLPLPGSSLSLEIIEGEPVSVVLALDASVDWQSFNAVRAGARALIESLGPRDEVALVVFSETVSTVLEFTSDKAEAAGALDTLIATGVFTVLNDAVLRAVAVAKTAPTAERAVVVVTNSGDRSGDSTAAQGVAQAAASGIPIHTVGYGPNAATDALAAIAAQTGGQAIDVATAADTVAALPQLAGLWRQVSYRLTFYSNVRADNQPHTVTIAVSANGARGEGSSSFVPVSRAIAVVVPGIHDGQAVVGKVYLVAEVESASPIVSVDYLLNGQLIASVPSPPYSFEWDSTTVNNGTYQLTVRATDVAGNQGERTIVVTVSLPFVVQISAAADRAQVGDLFSIEADVQTPARVAQVELLVDGQVVATDTTEPYRFAIDTGPFEPGPHTLTVRAVDALGRTAESSLPIRLTEAWLPIVVRWSFAALIGIAVLVTFIVGLSLMGAASRAGRDKLYRVTQVELTNMGNARTRYELRADDPNTALKFEFTLEGSALPQRQVIEPQASTGQGAAWPGAAPRPAKVAASGAGQGAGGAVGAAKGAIGFSSRVGGIISSIGYMLPGSLGRSLVNTGMQMKTGQVMTDQIEHQVSEVKDLASGGRMARQMHGPMQRETTKPAAASPPAATPTPASGIIRLWAQTPPVDPGQTLAVGLTLRPVKPGQSEPYFFRVVAQAIDVPDLPPVIEQGHIRIKGLSLFQRLLPVIILLATLGLISVLVVLLIFTIGLFG